MAEPAEPHRPEKVIDLTSQGQRMRYIEVLTDAGVIRVNTSLMNKLREPVIVVEVEQNIDGRPVTPAGGHWDGSTRIFSNRIDVILTKAP